MRRLRIRFSHAGLDYNIKMTNDNKRLKILFVLLLVGLAPLRLHADSLSPRKTAWLVRWHFDSPDRVKQICRASAGNFTHLLVQARGRADSWYKSDLAPRAEELKGQTADFDPLAEILAECGPTPVQAWLNVFYLWSGDVAPEAAFHPALPVNNLILRDNNGRRVSDYSELERRMGWIEGIYADPADRQYRQLMADVVAELLGRYPLSGIHLDFIRYPGSSYGFGGPAAQKFAEQWGFAPSWLPARIDPGRLRDWLDGRLDQTERLLITGGLIWAEMRADEVGKMLEKIRLVMAKSGPGLVLSAAVDPDCLTAYLDKGQDWQAWAVKGLVDELYPMAYFGGQERVTGQLKAIRAIPALKKIRLWAGLGAYIKESEEIGREAAIAGRLGYEGISLFSLGHLLEKNGGPGPYVQAVNDQPPVSVPQEKPATEDWPLPAEIKLLNLPVPPSPGKDNQLQERLAEFVRACNSIIPQALSRLEKSPPPVPDSLELRGILRFVHPLDGQQKLEEQRQLCAGARRLLKRGKDFATVSRLHSQAGTRDMGGLLPRLYRGEDQALDRLFRLAPGEISPMIRRADGYWCYQLVRKVPGKIETLANIPWPARRVLFKKLLEELSGL